MVKPVPTPGARAAGALIGHAAGNAMAQPGGASPESPWHAEVVFSVILGEELLASPVDLRRIAGRWAEWARRDGRGLGDWTREALRAFEAQGAPVERIGTMEGAGAVTWCLPIAIAALASPRNLVSGTYHIAALTHPDPVTAWAAVVVNVAAARLLSGYRDFVPDVLEMLRANEGPAVLVEGVRRVPLIRRDALRTADGPLDAVAIAEVVLWLAHHEPRLDRALDWLETAGLGGAAALAGGLLGARDGAAAIPAARLSAVHDAAGLRHLAGHLIGEA